MVSVSEMKRLFADKDYRDKNFELIRCTNAALCRALDYASTTGADRQVAMEVAIIAMHRPIVETTNDSEEVCHRPDTTRV